jgi:hypothetical protein
MKITVASFNNIYWRRNQREGERFEYWYRAPLTLCRAVVNFLSNSKQMLSCGFKNFIAASLNHLFQIDIRDYFIIYC